MFQTLSWASSWTGDKRGDVAGDNWVASPAGNNPQTDNRITEEQQRRIALYKITAPCDKIAC